MISIFGSSGFVGSKFFSMYRDKCIPINKNENKPKSSNILYFISTIDNYNVYTDPYLDINTNLIKLISVLEECKKINEKTPITFNFISSWFVYGKTNELPVKETSICNPTGFYSITKYAAEKLLISYCETFNIKYRILRLTNIIGETDRKISKKKNAIQYLINKVKNNEDIELYNNGNIVRDYMYVDDCCEAIMTCIRNADFSSITNISNCQPITVGEVINYSIQKTHSSSNIIAIPPPEFHKIVQIENIYLDNSRLLMLGYTPKTSVYSAIDKILGS